MTGLELAIVTSNKFFFKFFDTTTVSELNTDLMFLFYQFISFSKTKKVKGADDKFDHAKSRLKKANKIQK